MSKFSDRAKGLEKEIRNLHKSGIGSLYQQAQLKGLKEGYALGKKENTTLIEGAKIVKESIELKKRIKELEAENKQIQIDGVRLLDRISELEKELAEAKEYADEYIHNHREEAAKQALSALRDEVEKLMEKGIDGNHDMQLGCDTALIRVLELIAKLEKKAEVKR